MARALSYMTYRDCVHGIVTVLTADTTIKTYCDHCNNWVTMSVCCVPASLLAVLEWYDSNTPTVKESDPNQGDTQ